MGYVRDLLSRLRVVVPKVPARSAFPLGKDADLIRLCTRNMVRRTHRAPRKACVTKVVRADRSADPSDVAAETGGCPPTRAAIAFLIALVCTLSSPVFAQQRITRAYPVEQVQFTPTIPPPATVAQGAFGFRRIQMFSRSDLGPSATFQQLPTGESVAVISGGVNLVIQDLQAEGVPSFLGPLGNIDLETDRAVIWTSGLAGGGLGDFTQTSDAPLEIYMEGNIVLRQGDRTVFADRMFYDVRRQVGVILNAELLTPLPPIDGFRYEGMVRLKAAALRQLDQSRFVATDALITTSRLEEPTYHLGSQTITFQDLQQPVIDPFTGQPAVSPATNEPIVAHQRSAESRNNFLYLAGVPVFYWPTIATDLDKPSYYIDNVRVRNDSIFGTQLLLELDAYQLFGLPVTPEGTEWNLNLDLLSERGIGFGSTFEYGRDDLFGVRGPVNGLADLWFIKDDGVDNLGFGRRNIVPEKKFRGRAFWNHRQRLIGGPLDGWTAQAEVGWMSDRTFLEQYYENEWDQQKDQITGARLKRTFDNISVSVEANVRVNDFVTQTQWLPRGDFYWLGQPVLEDTLTFYTHAQAGFADLDVLTTPTNPTLAASFERLPWEEVGNGVTDMPISGRGERLAVRKEIDLPLEFAPLKIVPYLLGEAAHWGADLNGNDIQRLYGQGGVRASIPFWAVNPAVRDPLFNLSGLAHKVVFDAEFSYADANQNLNQFPLYDPLDGDAIEDIRRRLFFPIFGGGLAGPYYITGFPSTIDPKFDPRFYALRTGIQGWVTSPTTEIADDLVLTRVGMRHRLQTKRGPLGAQRIVDWLTFDSNVTWFPKAERDNLGQDFGMLDYDFRWHLGDRVSILSDGAAEFFGDGLRTAAVGMLLNRPARGNAYLGYRAIDGPNDADVVTATVNYRSTPKWIFSGSTTFEVGGSGNIGQSFLVSRIGESIIATLGARYDESKDNVGVNFLLEPRFLPQTNVTRRTGIEIPPAGVYGLE